MPPPISTASKLMTAIHQTSLMGVINALEAGDDIEEADIHGFNGLPLRTAAFAGNLPIIEELLRRGANINAAGSDGPGMPLRLALRSRKQETVDLLLAHGAQIPAGVTLGKTAQATPSPSAPGLPELPPLEFTRLTPDSLEKPAEPTRKIDTESGNMLEFVSTSTEFKHVNATNQTATKETLIEEINIASRYGVDTNLLTMDMVRFNESAEPMPAPTPTDSKRS